MKTIGSSDIIFLLGAGASAEKGIPLSVNMIQQIEKSLKREEAWIQFNDLYNHIKSAIYYSAGLQGQFNEKVNYNVEVLVNTLYELEQYENHPLYPFIGVWNTRFEQLAGVQFEKIKEFRFLILDKLKQWMVRENGEKYYNRFRKMREDINFPLRIFSLNYDLSIEDISGDGFNVETGFGKQNEQYFWDQKRFEEGEHSTDTDIFLYKLHGSINWQRNDKQQLISRKQAAAVDYRDMEIIFGRNFKLDAADPYLFYIYEFRQYCQKAKIIVIIGYAFADGHINKIINQSVRDSENKKIIVVSGSKSDNDLREKVRVGRALKLDSVHTKRVEIVSKTAKEFLESENVVELLRDSMPEEKNVPF